MNWIRRLLTWSLGRLVLRQARERQPYQLPGGWQLTPLVVVNEEAVVLPCWRLLTPRGKHGWLQVPRLSAWVRTQWMERN